MSYESLGGGNMMWTIIWSSSTGELRQCRSLGPASHVECLSAARERYPHLIAIIPGYNEVHFNVG